MIMRNFLKSFLFVALASVAFVSCEEDEFSEKEAMEELRHVDIVLTVVDPGNYLEPVEGVSVKVVGDSTTLERTTDSFGNVVFRDMKIGGNVGVYVEKENYTKAFYQVNTITNSYGQSQVSETLGIYSLSGDNLATVRGQLTIETDFTNRSREKVVGKEVRVFNRSLGDNIESAFVGTTDENGFYSVKVPVSVAGENPLYVYIPSIIEATQTLAMEVEEGVYEVVDTTAIYSSSYSSYEPTDIPNISSAVATVEAPIGVGSGFALGVKAKGTTFNSNSSIEVINGGSGYEIATSNDTILLLSEGINGHSAEVRVYVDDETGAITDINNYSSNGALYTSAPTLDLSVLGGEGAIIDILFACQYLVYIEEHGSNYRDIPVVSATYKEYEGEDIVERIDENLNSYNQIGIYSYYDFSDYVDEKYGTIQPDDYYAYDGDTLFVTKYLAEAPVLEVKEQAAEQAWIDLNVNSSGSVYVNNFYGGSGYDPANPPAVTVTGLAGYGTGAEIKAEVGTDGIISNFVVLDSGEGFVPNVNDYQGDGYPNPSDGSANYEGYRYLYGVGPGKEIVVDWYYGTGQRVQ
jgi:hypothetical protein